jgi:hypothetical protein
MLGKFAKPAFPSERKKNSDAGEKIRAWAAIQPT